jgi:hypothetical protein
MQRHELGHQVHLKLKELAALLEDKRPLMDKCHVSGKVAARTGMPESSI